MYTEGFGVALLIGVIALLLPALWIGWWLIADLGETVGGAERTSRYERFESPPRPVA